ncbi:hypothetical protein VHEMI09826 [[Torrubiella] hemipterigena]|uniref:C5a peptidase/Subtilisin-like protease SBT2-like Fn3-like domain-containing protein n=1 Tax=[Torrubiella] hemipterigena TaxID=1531966 RepID=A0A0A1TQS9_9HYPO|nr:hypothetical protein VHEMI09826 [[Torrubiella] hemipterigena]
MVDMRCITAKAHPFNDGQKQSNHLAPVAQQGPGMAQAWDAAYIKSLVYPYTLSFNDTIQKTTNFTLRIANTGDAKVEYNIGQVAASSIYILTKDGREADIFPLQHFKSSTKLDSSSSKIIADPGKVGHVHVRLTSSRADELHRLPYHFGYVSINGTYGSALTVPYQHIGADFQSILVIPTGATNIYNSTDHSAGSDQDAHALCSAKTRHN